MTGVKEQSGDSRLQGLRRNTEISKNPDREKVHVWSLSHKENCGFGEKIKHSGLGFCGSISAA